MAELEWSIKALEDLDRLGDFEAGRSLATASLLVRRLMSAAESLAEFPRLGRMSRNTDVPTSEK